MEEYFNNPYIRVGLAIVASSLALSIINLFPKIRDGEKWYHDNKVLILIISGVFTGLLTDFTGFFSDWQFITFKALIVVMISFLVAITKGQQLTDAVVNAVTNRIVKKADADGQANLPSQ